MPEIIAPGQCIGMLGGGQLGRMALIEGRLMGYSFAVVDPADPCPAGSVSDFHYPVEFDDEILVEELVEQCSVVTLEFENIPSPTLASLSEKIPVRPGLTVLETCQDRLKEKRFLQNLGIPCAPFRSVESLDDLVQAVQDLGTPSVLKTNRLGYDGKGQVKLESDTDLASAWEAVGSVPCVLEGWVPFDGEYSIIAARNPNGEVATYPVFHNRHRNHILWMSSSPVSLTEEMNSTLREIAEKIVHAFQLEGIIAIELFRKGDEWIVNEMAPRPHNSGHLTLDASVTSQFEQFIRAVCNLPLGSTEIMRPAVMVNLLGDLWARGEPDWADLIKDPDLKLHLYGKAEARPGRKMGHFTVLADSVEEAEAKAEACFAKLLSAVGG